MLTVCPDYAKLSRYCSIQKVLLLLYWRGRDQGQRGVTTCPEIYGQSYLIPQHIFSAETICFSMSFIGSIPLVLPLLLAFLGALSEACFSSLSLLSLGNLTHFLVFNNHPRGNTFTWLPSVHAPLLSARPFLQLPTGQQHHDVASMTCHLFFKTCSSSQTPYLSKITWLSTNGPSQKTQCHLSHLSFILLNTVSRPFKTWFLPLFPASFLLIRPRHPSPRCNHPIAITRMSQAHLLSLSFLSLHLLSIVPLTVTYSSPGSSPSSALLTSRGLLILHVTSFVNTFLDQIKSSCWNPYFPQF